MLYNSLCHLLSRSSSSREFFRALPHEVQQLLQLDSHHIHTQHQLRRMAEAAQTLLKKSPYYFSALR